MDGYSKLEYRALVTFPFLLLSNDMEISIHGAALLKDI
jgi:hypothetical protein